MCNGSIWGSNHNPRNPIPAHWNLHLAPHCPQLQILVWKIFLFIVLVLMASMCLPSLNHIYISFFIFFEAPLIVKWQHYCFQKQWLSLFNVSTWIVKMYSAIYKQNTLKAFLLQIFSKSTSHKATKIPLIIENKWNSVWIFPSPLTTTNYS